MRPVSPRTDATLDELLDELPDDSRRRAEQLLERLEEAGVSDEEARAAILEGRLHLLAIERKISGAERYSARDVAEKVGLETDVLVNQLRALGLAIADPDARTLTDDDLEAARRVKILMDTGVPVRLLEEGARVMAMALAQVAASNRVLVAGLLPGGEAEGGDPETAGPLSLETQIEASEALAGIADRLMPLIPPALEHIHRLQVREQLRHAAVAADLRAPGVEEVAVAFADLVGFTKLGERLPPEEYGEVTQQFSRLAASVATGPVRLVKMIGDAAMFSSPEPAALTDAVLGFLEAVREREDVPGVRAGLSWGDAVARAGDFYGRPVNLASRLTGAARPGSLLVAAEDLSPLEDRFRLSDAGNKRLKGIGSVRAYRCRRLESNGENG